MSFKSMMTDMFISESSGEAVIAVEKCAKNVQKS